MHHHLPLRNKVIIMLSVMASLFLVALDQTIISTALGRIVEEFNAYSSLSWVITAYLLTTTVTVPIAGKLSDLFGRRVVLLTGVTIFGIASLGSGLAANIDQLVLWRAIQGIGGGIITANAFTIIGDLFEARERSKWQGFIGAVFGLSSLVGPLLGGWLTDNQQLLGLVTDWRWNFYINVPIAIAALAVIAIYCPPLRHAKKPKIDYAGASLLTVGLATLVLAVDNTESIFADVLTQFNMTLSTLRIIMAVIVIVSLAAFVWVERRSSEPILPLRFFKNRTYVLVMTIASLFGVGFMGAIIYLTQFNQQVFAASPTTSGLMLLPMVGGLMLSSIGSGQLIARTGHYMRFMRVGMVLSAAMIALLVTLTPESPYWHEGIIMAILGFGLGLVMPIMNIAVQNEFKQKELGVATSSIQLFRGLGSTIGIAVFGAMLTGGLAANLTSVQNDAYISQLKQSPAVEQLGSLEDSNTLLALNSPDIKDKINEGFQASVESAPPQVRKEAEQSFYKAQQEYTSKLVHAFSDSLRGVFMTAAILMTLAVPFVFFIKERPLKKASALSTPGEM